MKPIKTVRYGEPFLILCEITNRSPYSIKFKNSNLKLASFKFCTLVPQKFGSYIAKDK